MADTGVFATTAEVQYKAGANASSTYNAELYINSFIAQAESRINIESGYNWNSSYGSLATGVKKLLTEASSNLAATYVIQADLSGFTSLGEAQTQLDVLRINYLDCIKLLQKAGDKLRMIKGDNVTHA
jgi:hypothetical protein